MDSVLKALLETTIYSSVVIAVISAVKAIWGGKIASRIIKLLWMLALLRLLLPITFASPVHIDALFPEKPAPAAVSPAETLPKELPLTPSEGVQPAQYHEIPDVNIAPADSYSPPQAEIHSPSFLDKTADYLKGISIWVYAFTIWAAGAAVFLLKFITEYIGFKRRVLSGKSAESLLLSGFIAECKPSLKIKKDVTVMVSVYLNTPITFGIFRPVILVPQNFLNHMEEAKLKMILMHELCHIKNRDLLVNMMWLLAKTVHWFNPLVWAAYRYYLEDVELSCDETVIKSLGEGERFAYSQSLIDVLKLTRARQKVPAALAFCRDRTKIRKRVENVMEPKKKLKSAGFIALLTAAVLIIGCFTTACQSTPEEEPAKAEAEQTPEEAANATAGPETDIPASEHIEGSYSEDEITVNIDADVLSPDLDNLVYVERIHFSQQQADKILDALFGGATLYDAKIQTKDTFEYIIENIEESADDLSSDLAQNYGIENLEDLRKLADEKIAEYDKLMQSAPAERPVIEKYDISQNYWLWAAADLGKDDMAYVMFSAIPNGKEPDEIEFGNFGGPYANRTRYIAASTSEPLDLADYNGKDFDTAKQAVEKLMEDMGLEGFRLETAYKSLDYVGQIHDWQEIPGVASDREFYVFSFVRDTGSMTVERYFYDGPGTDGVYDYTDRQYDNPLKYEDLDIWTEGGEIVQFVWHSPVKMVKMAHEDDEKIIGVEEAINSMIQHAFKQYTDRFQGLADSVIINIDRIEPSYVRVKQSDASSYITVPVWDFYGEVLLGISEENAKSIGLTLKNFEKDGDLYIINNELRSVMSVVASE